MNKKGIAFIIILVLIVVAFFVINGMLKSNMASQTATSTASTTPQVTNAIQTQDQQEGSQAFIVNASLAQGGFVVIQRNDNGQLGNIIGTSDYLPAGTQKQNFTVNLSEPMKAGDQLAAVLYADDGNQTFNAASDTPVMNNSVPVMATFQAVTSGKLQNENKG